MRAKQILLAVMMMLFAPAVVLAEADDLGKRLEVAVQKQVPHRQFRSLSEVDRSGTPAVISLAQQGDIETLMKLSQYQKNGEFLLLTDKYHNNVFHVAKDAKTIQALAALIRQFYPAQTQQVITRLANARNLLKEAPLNAQVNAGHPDTFRPIYRYTVLRRKNDPSNRQLSRCQDIIKESSANGIDLLTAVRAQIPYHPEMAKLAQHIEHIIPCLTKR
ncbi:MAG: hypothetical protein J6Y25_07165 [Elusimicrobiaceae bacterium]|nr:hypothetical protein [Elusimicrobiaceae bacterium]